MRIRGLGVIEDAVLDFSPGFNAVTGETGAGKTMVVTGLGLLFGGRSDAALVRPGSDRALVEGHVLLDAESPAARRAVDAGAELEAVDTAGGTGTERELIIARAVSPEGRSRAHVGGQSVPVGVLGSLADDLIATHGQSTQQRLLQASRQRDVLDRYAGDAVAESLAAYRTAYERLRTVEATLDELTTRARERAQEADLLRLGLAEIERVQPEPGEDEALTAEADRLSYADLLRTAAPDGHLALAGDPDANTEIDALGLIGAARHSLDGARGHDSALADLAQRLDEVSWLLTDLATDLASYAAGVDADPGRLAEVQERRAQLTALTRKYGPAIADVLAWSETAGIRLLELEGDDDRIDALRAEAEDMRGRLADLATLISTARAAAAEKFAAAVTDELTELAMPHARIQVVVAQRDAPSGDPGTALLVGERWLAFGPHGVDEVELRLAPHPGAPFLPIGKGASGGELSRVMLAIEVVFAGADPVPTFVFDEVDAGIGGRAAVEVGRRLARLARVAQVIVVTHLPQVAAFADRHLVVRKDDDGAITRSGVTVLDDAERRRELARMLAGVDDSEIGQAHAEELLTAAARDRDSVG
jgi:DNA repair protein RecN (Recombination protein N)